MFDALKSQLYTLQSRLGEQASREAAEEAKNAKKSWGSKRPTTSAMMPPDRNVYFDDYARKQTPLT